MLLVSQYEHFYVWAMGLVIGLHVQYCTQNQFFCEVRTYTAPHVTILSQQKVHIYRAGMRQSSHVTGKLTDRSRIVHFYSRFHPLNVRNSPGPYGPYNLSVP